VPRASIPAYRTHAAIIQIRGSRTYLKGTGGRFPPAPHTNPSEDMRSPFPILLMLALPLIEIAGFVVVGGAIGVLPTIALVIATGVAGTILLRIQGFGTLNRIRGMLEAGCDPSRELAHGLMILVAGILLIIPGFVTDLGGILLFLPPVRDIVWRMFSRTALVRAAAGPMAGFGFARPGRRETARTIDLDQDEYSARRDTPWRRLDE